MEGFDEIRDAAGVDPAWVTAVLHHAGVGRDRRIEEVSARSIGTGQVGENVRFSLTWSAGSDPVPASVVGKFPSRSELSRATAVQVDTYRREIGFYRDVQARVTIRTPTVHHIGWDPETHDFVLLMEDVRGAEQGDQLLGCTHVRAEFVVDEAVGLHAPTWGRVDQLGPPDWLAAPSPERTEQMRGLFRLTLPGFAERYAGRVSEDELAIAHALVEGYATLTGHVAAWAEAHGGWCITHADYRLDNILFGVTDRAPAVTVVDWQTTAIGIGPADVAYFVGAGLLPDERRRHEHGLVGRYAAGLRAAGVDVADAAVWDGYVLGSAGGYLMAIIASQIVERTDRGDDMFVAMATRHAAQVRDTGLLDRL